MSRSKEYERQAIQAIGSAAKADSRTMRDYAKQVTERLDAGAREYSDPENDDGWWRRGIERCIDEASEEAVDITGWILGCLQVLRDEVLAGRIDRDQGHLAQHLLIQAAGAGVNAYVSIQMAADIVREAKGRTEVPDRFSRPFSDPDGD